MSNVEKLVQRPMSNVQRQAQDREADVGRSTLDVGPSDADVGRSTLNVGLSVNDLRKSFYSSTGERIDVLRGVSFSATPGEAIAIMGASGAGKSTLLHLLGGLETADHGSIVAGTLAIDRASQAELARFRNQQVGFVFQFHHLLPDLTAAENVSLPLRVKRMKSREAMRRALTMLKQFGFDQRTSDAVVGHLSGGEQQRVAICRALVNQPAIVLADEPTGNLDAASGGQIADALASYAREHRALVIIATHNETVAEKCPRRFVLNAGRLSEADSL